MGAHQSIAESGQLRSSPHGEGQADSNEQISEDFRRRMHETIADAHATSSRPCEIVMPWEQPSMSWIFSDNEPAVIPNIPPIWDCVEPSRPSDGGYSEPAVVISSKPTFYSDAIAFNSRRTCHLSEQGQLDILSQKWESLISINYAAFDLGLHVHGHPFAERVRIVAEVLGGKSPGTLTRRLSQITRFVNWARKDAKREPFPVSGELIKNYVRHLRNTESGHTAYKGFFEVMKFMRHVVGLDCDLTAFDSAWVSGIIRAAEQSRPLRKQSTTLNVKSLLFLEDFLSDSKRALVDRYAVGVFLFAVYARARFGDLKRISRSIVDEVEENKDGSLGYLELHSDSHKMRATGNRLGAHLPLIAPIKGLGARAWGKDFVDVASQAGLDIRSWVPGRPLLPAPTIIGDWTDRSTTSSEVGKWLCGILGLCPDFVAEGFTPHGCKATTLVMLSKYGASPDDRLILGHHQVNKGALEVYSRDLQSAPLRVLEQMMKDIRQGRFSPDVTRSGLFTPIPQVVGRGTPSEVVPTPTSPLDDAQDLDSLQSFVPVEQGQFAEQSESQPLQPKEPILDDSDSSTCSDDSDAEQVILEMATSERPANQWHPGCDLYQHAKSKLVHAHSTFGHRRAFICGRALTSLRNTNLSPANFSWRQ